MKKFMTFILTGIIALSAVSCGAKKQSEPTPAAVQTVSFREAEITLGDEFDMITHLDRAGDNVLIFGIIGEKYVGFLTDTAFTDRREFELIPKDGESVKCAAVDKFGKTAVMTYLGGETMLYIYNSSGELFKEADIGELIPDSETGAVLVPTEDGYIVNLNNEAVYFMDSSLHEPKEIDAGNGLIKGVVCDNSGNPVLVTSEGISNIIGGSLTDTVKAKAMPDLIYTLSAGNEDYYLFADTGSGIFGFDGEAWVKLSDLSENRLNASDIAAMIPVKGSDIAVLCYDAMGSSLMMLTEQDMSAIKAKQIVRVGILNAGDMDISELIADYNMSHADGEYRFELAPYTPEDNSITHDMALNNLKLDIISGNAPDIITDFIPGLNPNTYYIDLMQFIDNDPDLNRDAFIPGFLDGISLQGKVPMIFPNFSVAADMAKTKFVGDKYNWTYEEFCDAVDSLPDDMTAFGGETQGTMRDFFAGIVDYDDFIDYDSGTCHFDEPVFIRLLKLVKEHHIGVTTEEFKEDRRINGSFLFFDSFDFSNDKVLIEGVGFENVQRFFEYTKARANEPVSFVGKPSKNGTGTKISSPHLRFSIMATSKHPEAAWELIKFAFGEKYNVYEFPVLESEFEKRLEEGRHFGYYDGVEEHDGQGAWHYDDSDASKCILYDEPTDAEMAGLEALIREAVKHYKHRDADRDRIIDEELTEYFDGNERTAEKTAEIIQNRMTIYLSERYS